MKYGKNYHLHKNYCHIHTIIIVLILTINLFNIYKPQDLNIILTKNKWLTLDKDAFSKSIFFGILSSGDIQRQEIAISAWIHKLHEETKSEAVFFIKNESQPTIVGYKYVPLVPYYCNEKEAIDLIEPIYEGKDFRLNAIMRLSSVKYFLYETDHEWFWSLNEECQVDHTNVNRIVEELDQKYDTVKDFVFQGHCIHDKKYFIHGGCGAIFSRRAAMKFLEYGLEWIEYIDNERDDVEFSHFREEIGMNISETQSPYIYGFLMPDPEIDWYRKELPNCPNETPKDNCKSGLYPIRQFSAYFAKYKDHRNKVIKLMREAREFDSSIHYYFDYNYIHFCRKKNDTENNSSIPTH